MFFFQLCLFLFLLTRIEFHSKLNCNGFHAQLAFVGAIFSPTWYVQLAHEKLLEIQGGSTGGTGGGCPPNLSIGRGGGGHCPPTLGYNTQECHYCLYFVTVCTGENHIVMSILDPPNKLSGASSPPEIRVNRVLIICLES